MDIKEVLKLKEGTKVKIAGKDTDVWTVVNRETLVIEDIGLTIEDKYTLDFIVNANFEKFFDEEDYEKLVIDEVLCKHMVGHIIKRVGDDPTIYKVVEVNGKFDLEVIGSPMRISDEQFLSTVINSLYIDLDEFENM